MDRRLFRGLDNEESKRLRESLKHNKWILERFTNILKEEMDALSKQRLDAKDSPNTIHELLRIVETERVYRKVISLLTLKEKEVDNA